MRCGRIGLAGLAVAAVSGCVVVEHTETLPDEVWDQPVTAVVADVGAGSLDVAVGGDQVVVARQVRWTGDSPEVIARVEGDVLHLEVQCRALQRVCAVDHQVTLPASASLDASLGSGALTAAGLDGTITVDVGSGDVSLSDVAGQVTVSAGSGAVSIVGVAGSLVAELGSGGIDVVDADLVTTAIDGGSGDVALALVAPPTEVVVDLGSGSVDLSVPAGAYALTVDTGSGEVSLDGVTADRRSDRRIEVTTGSGDVTITGD